MVEPQLSAILPTVSLIIFAAVVTMGYASTTNNNNNNNNNNNGVECWLPQNPCLIQESEATAYELKQTDMVCKIGNLTAQNILWLNLTCRFKDIGANDTIFQVIIIVVWTGA